MKKLMMPILAAGLMLTAVSCGNNSTETTSSDTTVVQDSNMQAGANEMQRQNQRDEEFAMKAAEGGMMEVMMGELAQKNGASGEVKDFGKMMVTDHSKANDELKALAAQKNINLPSTLGNEKQDKYNDLAKKTGKDFDKDYIDLMVKDHEHDIDEFQEEADKGNDPDIKAFAAKTLPTLQHHYDRIKQIRDAQK